MKIANHCIYADLIVVVDVVSFLGITPHYDVVGEDEKSCQTGEGTDEYHTGDNPQYTAETRGRHGIEHALH